LNKFAVIGLFATVALASGLVFLACMMFQERLYRLYYRELLDGWLFYGDLLFKMNLTSMEPTIYMDDVIVIKNITDVSEINVGTYGDIVVFYEPKTTGNSSDSLIVHRAINKVAHNEVTYFRTKGDANTTSDLWPSDYRGEEYSWQGMISEKLLIGKVIDIIPSNVLSDDSVPCSPSG
jgi:signal peptidase I